VPTCFVEAPQSIDELSTIARAVPFPQLANMLPGGVTPILPADELEQLGFRVVVDPVGTLLTTGHVVRQLAKAMLNEGRVDLLSSQMLGFDEVKRLLGLDENSDGIR
jgi:2,3-dimethylmalate lyase